MARVIKAIARYKNYLARSNGYLLVATFGLTLWNIFPNWLFAPAFFTGVSAMLYAGYLDCKLGLFKEEQRHTGKQHPYLLEILEEIKKR